MSTTSVRRWVIGSWESEFTLDLRAEADVVRLAMCDPNQAVPVASMILRRAEVLALIGMLSRALDEALDRSRWTGGGS